MPLIKHKDDKATVQKLRELGYPEIAPILPYVLEWMQDCNWPVAGLVSELLTEVGEPVMPEIRRVLLSDDDCWKYWCLGFLGEMESSIAMKLLPEVSEIANNSTPSEIYQELPKRAKYLLDKWKDIDPPVFKGPETQEEPGSASFAETLKSGYIIRFSGPEFDVDEFLRDSKLKPDTVSRRGEVFKGQTIKESSLFFDDIREGEYPLDASWEAIDRLESRIEEFARLAEFPGVEERVLTVFGSSRGCFTFLGLSRINILHLLRMEFSIGSYW